MSRPQCSRSSRTPSAFVVCTLLVGEKDCLTCGSCSSQTHTRRRSTASRTACITWPTRSMPWDTPSSSAPRSPSAVSAAVRRSHSPSSASPPCRCRCMRTSASRRPLAQLLARVVHRFQPDIVHCHTPFSVGWQGLRAARAERIPVLGTHHTLFGEYVNSYLRLGHQVNGRLATLIRRYVAHFYNQCDLTSSASRFLASDLASGGMRRPVHSLTTPSIPAFSAHSIQPSTRPARRARRASSTSGALPPKRISRASSPWSSRALAQPRRVIRHRRRRTHEGAPRRANPSARGLDSLCAPPRLAAR